MIKQDDIRAVTINMEHTAFDQGLAAKLADRLGGPCYSLAQMRAETLLDTVRSEMSQMNSPHQYPHVFRRGTACRALVISSVCSLRSLW